MDLERARTIKQQIREQVLAKLIAPAAISALGVSARRMTGLISSRSLAVGISVSTAEGFRIAVRVQRSELGGGPHLAAIRDLARGEVDVRYVGRIYKSDALSLQGRNRPLRIGSSIGHFRITAGTLGCFVESLTGLGSAMVLSNNHVLADENRGAIGDAILQPGAYDGGRSPADIVASLTNFEPLQTSRPNMVDCSVAEVSAGIDITPGTIDGIGALLGVRTAPLQTGESVRKTGRTTGTTTGQITAFDVDNVVVGYESGDFQFDNQIEIEGTGNLSFSRGGDSGSLVVDQNGQALGLLFAGGDTGGANGLGLTYVNPIGPVLEALNIRLVTGA